MTETVALDLGQRSVSSPNRQPAATGVTGELAWQEPPANPPAILAPPLPPIPGPRLDGGALPCVYQLFSPSPRRLDVKPVGDARFRGDQFLRAGRQRQENAGAPRHPHGKGLGTGRFPRCYGAGAPLSCVCACSFRRRRRQADLGPIDIWAPTGRQGRLGPGPRWRTGARRLGRVTAKAGAVSRLAESTERCRQGDHPRHPMPRQHPLRRYQLPEAEAKAW